MPNNPDELLERVIPRSLELRRQWLRDGEIMQARILACWPALREALAAIPHPVSYSVSVDAVDVTIFGLSSVKDVLPFLDAIENAVGAVFNDSRDFVQEHFASRKFCMDNFPLTVDAFISSTSETCHFVPDGTTVITNYKLVCE